MLACLALSICTLQIKSIVTCYLVLLTNKRIGIYNASKIKRSVFIRVCCGFLRCYITAIGTLLIISSLFMYIHIMTMLTVIICNGYYLVKTYSYVWIQVLEPLPGFILAACTYSMLLHQSPCYLLSTCIIRKPWTVQIIIRFLIAVKVDAGQL